MLFPSHPRGKTSLLGRRVFEGTCEERKLKKNPFFLKFWPAFPGTLCCCGRIPLSVLEDRWPPALGLEVVLAVEAAVVVEEEEVLGRALVPTFR